MTPLVVKDKFLVRVFQKVALPGWKGQRSIQVRPDVGFFGLSADAEVVDPEFFGQDVHNFQIIAQALVRLKFGGKALHVCSAFDAREKRGPFSRPSRGRGQRRRLAPVYRLAPNFGLGPPVTWIRGLAQDGESL